MLWTTRQKLWITLWITLWISRYFYFAFILFYIHHILILCKHFFLCYNLSMSKPFSGNYRISGAYGATGGAYGKSTHKGVDFALPNNTPVLAANGGIVLRTGRQAAAGVYVVIGVNNREELYFHLNRSVVSVGNIVSSGQLIGYSGKTGNTTGFHLHYEVRIAGKAVDPTPYYTAVPPPPAPVSSTGGGIYRARRHANVRPAPTTLNTPFQSRQLKPGNTFRAIKAVEGQRVNQNGVNTNIWILSTKNGFVWSGNLQKIQ